MATPPTEEQLRYMQEHIEENRSPSIFISTGVGVGVAFASLILRLIARRRLSTGLGKDDYAIVVAFVS
jgi:hypothetical protein